LILANPGKYIRPLPRNARTPGVSNSPWTQALLKQRIEDAAAWARLGATPAAPPPPLSWKATIRLWLESVPYLGPFAISCARRCLALWRSFSAAR
jgi:hypothetical protein